MNAKTIKGVLILIALVFMGWQTGIAQAQDQQPSPQGQARGQDTYGPQKPEQAPESGSELAGIYGQLRELANQYKEARTEETKRSILVRAESLMGQIFDAKVNREQVSIDAEEKRLNRHKQVLHRKQSQRREWMHHGVQLFFETGEVPELEISQEP